ncbi:ABC transporter, solute-binding domain protein [Parvimonas sp. oral taxon 393 str. F0440]|nr:ABC transporter, solute-binding domain protein [Parvimonas sp. oral taxon 393 str. F0440]
MPKLLTFDKSLYDAGMDLGARQFQVFKRIVLPQLIPNLIIGALVCITMSLDDFTVSYFTSGNGVATLSVKIYSMTKRGISPKINALSTLLFAIIILISTITYIFKNKGVKNEKIKNLLVLLLVLIATVSLTACGKNDKKEEKKEEKTEQSSEKKVLNVTNTDLFIDPETIKEFEKEYNCKVNYTFFEENEEYYTKLKSGAEKYDVIVASDYMVDTMIKENMLEKLDKNKIPNMEKVKKNIEI